MSANPRSVRKKDGHEPARSALERNLEEGLKGTFPASDPVAVIQPAAAGRQDDDREE